MVAGGSSIAALAPGCHPCQGMPSGYHPSRLAGNPFATRRVIFSVAIGVLEICHAPCTSLLALWVVSAAPKVAARALWCRYPLDHRHLLKLPQRRTGAPPAASLGYVAPAPLRGDAVA